MSLNFKSQLSIPSSSITKLFPEFFAILPGGTFPVRNYQTVRGPKTQQFNSFMVTTASNVENAIYYRLISCPCVQCLNGTLQRCMNHPFVPNWESSIIGFKSVPHGITAPTNNRNIRLKLQLLMRERPLLAWFCCLGWVANQQQPAVLLMQPGCIRINPLTVKCHQLKAWKPVPNDFTNTIVEKPPLCNKLSGSCNCTKRHAMNFPIAHILEVAVVKGTNNSHKSLFCKFSADAPNSHLSLIRFVFFQIFRKKVEISQ